MGVLDRYPSSLANIKVTIPKKIENTEETVPKITLNDTRVFLPTREEVFTMEKLMLAHNIDEYRKSKSEITLLPKINIEFDKILADKDNLAKEYMDLTK